MKSTSFKNHGLKVAANMFFPEDFDEGKKYPALAVAHPAGGVKEQTAGLYAEKIAKAGYVTMAFDASYQGESEGSPRGFEDPTTRVGDIHAAIDYFMTLPYVDADRIGAVGICAGGGYTIKAAQTDRRIKAIVGVSPADIGLTFREGWFGNAPDDVFGILEKVAAQRTAEAQGAEPLLSGWVPDAPDANLPQEIQDGYEYYRTPRAQHKNSVNRFPFVCFDRVIEFSAYDEGLAKLLKVPMLLLVGEKAGTRWEAEKAYALAKCEKELVLFDGANHFDMYDKRSDEAVEKIIPFLKKHLK